jgi:hypothetical protein
MRGVEVVAVPTISIKCADYGIKASERFGIEVLLRLQSRLVPATVWRFCIEKLEVE